MKSCAPIVVVLVACSAHAVEIDFDTEIVPVLSKAGCNAAACHGGAAGQAGFRMSLFGGDAAFDYRTIVHELEGRRLNFGQPSESLLLAKPTGQTDHGGGEVLDSDSDGAQTIAKWITSGARRLKARQLERLVVSPREFVRDRVPAEFQLNVLALFSDGTERDVTDLAVYRSQNESALEVGASGKMRVLRPGRHAAVIRFGGQVDTVSVLTPIGVDRPTFSVDARRNWIDDQINATLSALRLEAAPTTDDATFFRRLTLDLTGRLPKPDTARKFRDCDDEEKRKQAISQFLASYEFTEYWTHWLATQLRIRKPGTDEAAANALYGWLGEQVANDVGWDDIVNELITSEGDTHENGAATVHRFFATAREEAEYVSEVFMGVRLRCANCHNHPLDQWTQDDYHGLAAVFAGMQRGQVVHFTERGEVTHPRTGLAAVARIPGGHFIESGSDKRQDLVAWLTHGDNRYFARAMVGRVWELLMGQGLVTPVDDLRATNPASHPRLLDKLSDFFVEHDYRVRPLIELICNSAAYARSSTPLPNRPADSRFYSFAKTKDLSAEVLADAISDVTGVVDDYGPRSLALVATSKMESGALQTPARMAAQPGNVPASDITKLTVDETVAEPMAYRVNRAINVVDRTKSNPTLQFLGQCLPGEACAANAGAQRGIASKLHLMNGELLNEKIANGSGRLARLLAGNATTEQTVVEFYLRALSREPREQELAMWSRQMDASDGDDERKERCEDFLWALLNCHEFTTIH